MDEKTIKTIKVPIEEATSDTVEPFGQILGRHGKVRPIGVEFYKGAVATSRPVDYYCDGKTELSLSCINPRPGKVRYLERHFLHTQTFVPLEGKSFILVMAPPNEEQLPDISRVKAFRFNGDCGFMMHVGTWHEFPFALEDQTDLVVVLSAQTREDLGNKTEDGNEAFGKDLQKQDILSRMNVELVLDL